MDDRERLKWAFEKSPSVFQLLTTVRSRRVGHGYRIDSGTEYKHPVTGRTLKQAAGPMKFVSKILDVTSSELVRGSLRPKEMQPRCVT